MEYGDIGTVLMVYNGTKSAEEFGNGILTPYAQGILERSAELGRNRGR